MPPCVGGFPRGLEMFGVLEQQQGLEGVSEERGENQGREMRAGR